VGWHAPDVANPLGVIAVGISGVFITALGLAVFSDWRGWGSAYYRWTTRLPLPGAAFYREWGFGTFRWMVGGGGVAVGLLFLAVAGWGGVLLVAG
jgi:hypothetical protein